MAEAILKRLVSTRPDAAQWHIESAGTWAIDGYPAAEYSQYAMQSMGMDISSHRSKSINRELINQFDLILTMDNSHKEGIIAEFGLVPDRIFMLSEMVGLINDIPDPIGRRFADYEETAHLLERLLSNGLEQIVHNAEMNHNKQTRNMDQD
jgi:protein-tyrosine-phosphatase